MEYDHFLFVLRDPFARIFDQIDTALPVLAPRIAEAFVSRFAIEDWEVFADYDERIIGYDISPDDLFHLIKIAEKLNVSPSIIEEILGGI
jgi:hypothetical protein